MITRLFQAKDLHDEQSYAAIATLFHEGQVVVFPTETVYGLGACYDDENALEKIFSVKGRPADNPLIVHVLPDYELSRIVEFVPETAQALIRVFWPGPLTLVFKKKSSVSPLISGGLPTIAVRSPNHPIAKKLLKAVGKPLAAPSANLSGRPSSTTVDHVLEDFDGRVAAIVDGGPSALGLESTVLDVSVTPPVILRPGSISADSIEAVLKMPLGDTTTQAQNKPKAPGMKYRHYQPQGVVTLIKGSSSAVVHHLQTLALDEKHHNTAWIMVDEYAQTIQVPHVFSWGSLYDPATLAARLYALLREMDHRGYEHIMMHGLLEDPLSQAVMNRLEKAATHIIRL